MLTWRFFLALLRTILLPSHWLLSLIAIVISQQKECFWGVLESACMSIHVSSRPSVRVSVCVQNIKFCQSAGGDIKSHLVAALVETMVRGEREINLTTMTHKRQKLHHCDIYSNIACLSGYTSRVYGLKSNCKLKDCRFVTQPYFKVKVVPALPQLQVTTSLLKSASFLSFGEDFNVVTSATTVLYTGQR